MALRFEQFKKPHRLDRTPDTGEGFPVDYAARLVISLLEQMENAGLEMVPLYAARIEDLGPSDFVKIDCAACSYTALLTPAFLARLGLEPRHRVLDLKDRVRCRGVVFEAGRSCQSNGKGCRVGEFILHARAASAIADARRYTKYLNCALPIDDNQKLC